MLLVLFGTPGAGKSYVGHLLAREFDFYFHDGDHELPDEMRVALASKQPVTDAMRDAFFARIIAVTATLAQTHPRLVVAQTFLKERYRLAFLAAHPQAQFVLVQSTPELIEERFRRRRDYLIDLDDARRMAALFDPPKIPHYRISNDDGDPALIEQLGILLAVLEQTTS